eukprot:1150607-Pelagomonas_calceolata.AAC.1
MLQHLEALMQFSSYYIATDKCLFIITVLAYFSHRRRRATFQPSRSDHAMASSINNHLHRGIHMHAGRP